MLFNIATTIKRAAVNPLLRPDKGEEDMGQIRVKQTRSTIGRDRATVKVMNALGLRRIGAERSFNDNNCIRGMVNKVSHLVSYELVKK